MLFFMLCGIPYSGKSTWKDSLDISFPLSTDYYLLNKAKETNISYQAAFNNYYMEAELSMYKDLDFYLNHKLDPIVWDQTNLTVNSRAKKLRMIPDDYTKIAVWFETPSFYEIKKRMAMRESHSVDMSVILSMSNMFKIPTREEGFDCVIRGN